MPQTFDVFVNYRTGDKEDVATMIGRELELHLGAGRVFFDHSSIPPGAEFPQELISGVRRCHLLLAVIGDRWTDVVSSGAGGRTLHDPGNWTRLEILEARDNGVPVVPVLVGDAPWLRVEQLPEELAWLVRRQYLPYRHRTPGADLDRIVRVVTDYLPAKPAEASGGTAPKPPLPPGGVINSTGPVSGPVAQFRDVTSESARGVGVAGSIGTVINDPSGPVSSGSGPQHNHAPRFTGDGAHYNAGDVSGGQHHHVTFGRDDDRDRDRRNGGDDDR